MVPEVLPSMTSSLFKEDELYLHSAARVTIQLGLGFPFQASVLKLFWSNRVHISE